METESLLSLFDQFFGNPYVFCGLICFAIFISLFEYYYWSFRRRRGRRLYNKLLSDLKNDCHNSDNFDFYVYLYIDKLSRFDKSCICDFLCYDKINFYIDVCMIYILIDFDDRFKKKGV